MSEERGRDNGHNGSNRSSDGNRIIGKTSGHGDGGGGDGLGHGINDTSSHRHARLGRNGGDRIYYGRIPCRQCFSSPYSPSSSLGYGGWGMWWFTLLLLVSLFPQKSLASTFNTTTVANVTTYDQTIQQAAYAAFTRLNPGTGSTFGANLTGDLANVTVLAVRLRAGSLRRRGVTLGKFTIPPGLKVLNFASTRVMLVYRDFGNVSVYSSPVSGQVLVSQVVGIKAYDGDNLNNTSFLPPLSVSNLLTPSQVDLNVTSSTSKATQCVEFGANNTAVTSNVTSGSNSTGNNVCSLTTFGDFALLGLPPPGKKSNTWKIVLGVVLGVVGLLLLLLLLCCCIRRQLRRRKMAKMQYQVDHGETLQPHLIGNSRAPAASVSRTRPSLEKDYLETE